MSDLKEVGKPIPFIICEKNQGFRITQEAIDFLSSLNSKRLGVISVVGKYRTGKSFLLNRIILQQKPETGFAVGPTVNSCTKGIWLWSLPLKSENPDEEDFDLLVMDTEGFGGINEGQNHDTRIFIFSILLSSMFIYNSVGSIDENALQNLSLVVNLAREIQKGESGSKSKEKNRVAKFEGSFTEKSIVNNSQYNIDESRCGLSSKNPSRYFGNELDEDTIAENFPSFFWIIRDFALELIDSFGNPINSKKYLELALENVKGNSDAAESKNKIRKLIKHFFKQRDCLTLVRPVEQERDLQNLENLPDSSLRPEFLSQAKKARRYILTKTPIKKINKTEINGVKFLHFAQSIVTSINQGKAPNIDHAWNYIITCQHEKLLKDIFAKTKRENVQVKSPEDINRIISEIEAEFEREKFGSHDDLDNTMAAEAKVRAMDEIRSELNIGLGRFRRNLKTNIKDDTDRAFDELLNIIISSSDIKMEKVEKMVQLRFESLSKFFESQGEDSKKWLNKFFSTKKVDLYAFAMKQIEVQRQIQEREISDKLLMQENSARESQKNFSSKLLEYEHQLKISKVKIEELERQSNKYLAVIENYKEDKERISNRLKGKEEELAKIEFEIFEEKDRKITELQTRIYQLESSASENQNVTNKEILISTNKLAFCENENQSLKALISEKHIEIDSLKSALEFQKNQNIEFQIQANKKQEINSETEIVVSRIKYRDLKEKVKELEVLRFSYEKIIHEINEEKHIIQSQFEILKDNYEEQKSKNLYLLNEIKNKIDNLETGAVNAPMGYLPQDLSIIKNNKSEFSSFPIIRNSPNKNQNKNEMNKEEVSEFDLKGQTLEQKNLSRAIFEKNPNKSANKNLHFEDKILSISVLKCNVNDRKCKENSNNKKNLSKFTEYILEIKTDEKIWTVTRRFRDFCELMSIFKLELPEVSLPPSAKEILKFMGDLWNLAGGKGFPHEERQRTIERALKELSMIEEFRENSKFKAFLGIKENTI